MSPLKEISNTQADFLQELFARLGLPIDGQAFRVAFGDKGAERIIVVGKKTVASDDDVLAAVSGILAGAEFFRPVSAESTEAGHGIVSNQIDPSTRLHDLFQGKSPRVPNVLKRGGFQTVGEVLTILQEQDGDKRLAAVKHVGPKTIVEIKQKLGLG